MKLHIKNMVCNRCIMVVEGEIKKLGFQPKKVILGEVELKNDLDSKEIDKIDNHLQAFGFKLLEDKKSKLVGQIKSLIIEIIHQKNNAIKINLSTFLSDKLSQDYTYLSNLFSESEGTTIEKYYINQRIERVKELLVYNELSLSEIAFEMNYSSVAHLSNQFKKVTSLTPSNFRKNREGKRKPLDEI